MLKFDRISHASTDHYESYRLYEILAALHQAAASNYQHPLNLNATSVFSHFKTERLQDASVEAGMAVFKQLLIGVSSDSHATNSLLTARQPIEYIVRLKDLFPRFPLLQGSQPAISMPIVPTLRPMVLSNASREAFQIVFKNTKVCFTDDGKLYSKKYQTTQNVSMELYSAILVASSSALYSPNPIHFGNTETGKKLYKVFKNPESFNIYMIDSISGSQGSCAKIYFGHKLSGKPIAVKESKQERKPSENIRKECFIQLSLNHEIRERQEELKSRFPECFKSRLKKGRMVEEQTIFQERPIFFEEESDRMAGRRYNSDSSGVRISLSALAQMKADLLKMELNQLRSIFRKEVSQHCRLKLIEAKNSSKKSEAQMASEKLELGQLTRTIAQFTAQKEMLANKIAVLKDSYEKELTILVAERSFAIKQMQKNLFSFCQKEIAGMALLHALHKAHCDYKKQNILVDRSYGQNNPVIADVAGMINLINPQEKPNLHSGERSLPIPTMTPTTTSLSILKEMHEVVLKGERAGYNRVIFKHDINSLGVTVFRRLTGSEASFNCGLTELGNAITTASVMNLSDVRGNPVFQLLPLDIQEALCEMLFDGNSDTLEKALAIFRSHANKTTVE